MTWYEEYFTKHHLRKVGVYSRKIDTPSQNWSLLTGMIACDCYWVPYAMGRRLTRVQYVGVMKKYNKNCAHLFRQSFLYFLWEHHIHLMENCILYAAVFCGNVAAVQIFDSLSPRSAIRTTYFAGIAYTIGYPYSYPYHLVKCRFYQTLYWRLNRHIVTVPYDRGTSVQSRMTIQCVLQTVSIAIPCIGH